VWALVLRCWEKDRKNRPSFLELRDSLRELSSSFETIMKSPQLKNVNFKIVLLGDAKVGKSSIMLRYTENRFLETTSRTPPVMDVRHKTVLIDDARVKLTIWDTAGQEQYRSITSSYFRGTAGFILVYSVNDEASFFNIRSWMKEIECNISHPTNCILVGNKAEIHDDATNERKITSSEGQKLADELGMHFFETSAKQDINIEEAFMAIAIESHECARFDSLLLFELLN